MIICLRFGAPFLLLCLCFMLRAKITSSLVTFINVQQFNVQQPVLADEADEEEEGAECQITEPPNIPREEEGTKCQKPEQLNTPSGSVCVGIENLYV